MLGASISLFVVSCIDSFLALLSSDISLLGFCRVSDLLALIIYRRDRGNKGGGVLLAIDHNLPSRLLHSDPLYEFILCSVSLVDMELFVACIYRPPAYDDDIFP